MLHYTCNLSIIQHYRIQSNQVTGFKTVSKCYSCMRFPTLTNKFQILLLLTVATRGGVNPPSSNYGGMNPPHPPRFRRPCMTHWPMFHSFDSWPMGNLNGSPRPIVASTPPTWVNLRNISRHPYQPVAESKTTLIVNTAQQLAESQN